MKYILLITILFLLVFYEIPAQEKETNSFGVSDEVKIEGAPKYYSNYFSEYYINENFYLRVELNEKTISNFNGVYSVFDFPFLAKHKITDKFSVLLGPKVRLFKGNGAIERLTLLSTFRIQYDVTESLSIEGGVNFNLTPNKLESDNYFLDDNMIYRLGGRFKF